MMAHRIEMTIQEDGSLKINDLPFHSGEKVEVIILSERQSSLKQTACPLRGTKVEYIDPFKPVAESDWGACQ